MLYSSSIMQSDLQELTGRENIPFEKLEDKTVFITGAGGMLAYYTLGALMYLNKKRNLNIHVIALVRNSEKVKKQFDGFLSDPNFSLLLQDVNDNIWVEGAVDYIVHAAGASSPYAIKHDPVGIIRANTEGTRQVLELAKHKKVHSLLYTSTREVYGEVRGKECLDMLQALNTGSKNMIWGYLTLWMHVPAIRKANAWPNSYCGVITKCTRSHSRSYASRTHTAREWGLKKTDG